jgi:transcriptional regulator with XRE-family HTH domain
MMDDGGGGITGDARAEFGRRVRELRQARRISQERLAEIADLHRTYVSSLERGQRNVSLDNIHALARALGVSPRDLFPEGGG